MSNRKQLWQQYCADELALLTPILVAHGFHLDDEQPHLKGERFLQQAVTTTSGKKLILYGTEKNGVRVVIKATRNKSGKEELRHERTCRKVLSDINFAAEVFHTPSEIAWIEERSFVISIQKFITQEKTFLARPIEEQFSLALAAFKAQEGTHATTYNHRQRISGIYEIRDARVYLNNFSNFTKHIKMLLPKDEALRTLLLEAYKTLAAHKITIEQYCGFLTHTDFVPHNLRISKDTIYLLDHSSLTFGNKYEGWARFLNFMTLYNPPLADALTQYVKNNRTPEELESLHMLRLYRLGEIIFYYAKTLSQSDGDLYTLNRARVDFWGTVLSQLLLRKAIPESIITDYQEKRDSLRTSDEKERQEGLH